MKTLTKITFAVLLGIGTFASAKTYVDTNHHSNKTEVRELIALGFGEISPRTGRPATNYVHGYYRSNGTYVNGYWRS